MKAIVIHTFGDHNQLKISDLATPEPLDDEVLVEVSFASVNPVDWKIRNGFFKDFLPHQFPIILGWEASGEVKRVGKNVTSFKLGNKVITYCSKPVVQWGSYAEYVCVNQEALAVKPKNWDLRETATIPIAGLTAWQSLVEFSQLQRGESVLIHAGAGSVGNYAIQLAKIIGAQVFTTASEKNHSYVKELGADLAIDYTKQDFTSVIRDVAPNGVDVVLDSIGDKIENLNFSILKDRGRLVSIVNPHGPQSRERKDVRAGFVSARPNRTQLEEILKLIESGKIRPPEIEEFHWFDVAAAHRKSETGHARGKIVLGVK